MSNGNQQKGSLVLTSAPELNKLLCQEIHSFHSFRKRPLSDSYQVQNDLYLDQKPEENVRNVRSLSAASKV